MFECPDLDLQLKNFQRNGYLVLPGFLPSALVARLIPEVNRWVDTGLRRSSVNACLHPETYGPPTVVELQMEAHGELASHPPLLELLSDPALLGPDFVFHHQHSDRRPADGSGKSWHHDYEEPSHGGRAHPMIHTLHYLGGLVPGTGALVVLPGSHLRRVEKDAWSHRGTAELPGEVLIDALPPRSTVVLHSALMHARRAPARPRADSGPRYMVDASYCRTGTLWPPVKPYWRMVLAAGRARGLGEGRWPELFAERHFSEYGRADARVSP